MLQLSCEPESQSLGLREVRGWPTIGSGDKDFEGAFFLPDSPSSLLTCVVVPPIGKHSEKAKIFVPGGLGEEDN